MHHRGACAWRTTLPSCGADEVIFQPCGVDTRLKRHNPGASRVNFEPGNHRSRTGPPAAGAARERPLAYTAFCYDHWPVYWRFESAVAGSPHRGGELAHSAIQEVAARWPAVLGSASP